MIKTVDKSVARNNSRNGMTNVKIQIPKQVPDSKHKIQNVFVVLEIMVSILF